MEIDPLTSSPRDPARDAPSRRAAACGAFLALGALVGCRPAAEAPPPDNRPVRYMKVEMFPGGETVSLTGTVQAQSEINLSFRIDGRVVERRVDVGARVKAGQLIAVLNPENEESGVAGARANVAAARAQLVEARNNYDRHKELLAQNFISKARFDQVEATFRAAQSQVTAAQSQLDIASNRLGYTRLVADSPGTVTAVGAEPGEVVQAGSESGRDAVFGVPPRIKDVVPANPEVTVVLTSDPKVTAEGRVREVSPRADPATGTFAVRVGLIDPPAGMRLGSTVTGRTKLGGEAGINIPVSALTRDANQPAVWVIDPTTKAVSPRAVEVLRNDPARVVIGKGLKEGDLVVTAGIQALRPGQTVRLLESKR
jgi:membrane fusion protein, multidrug efflux system